MKKKIVALLLLALLLAQPLALAVNHVAVPTMAYQVIQQVNMERSRRGLQALGIDYNLRAAAYIRAQEMLQKFSHTRPNGSKWNTVSKLAYGENIARGQRSVDKVMAAWMSSQGHRQNILRPGYGSIGVSCIKAGNIYYWVQLFGR